jgi:hypothetical protein
LGTGLGNASFESSNPAGDAQHEPRTPPEHDLVYSRHTNGISSSGPLKATATKTASPPEPSDIEWLLRGINPLVFQQFHYLTDQLSNSQTAYHLTQSLKPIFGTIETETNSANGVITPKTLWGIRFLKEEAVLSTYHDLLQALQIYNPAIMLGKSAIELHSDLFPQANCQAGLVCLNCKKPINNSSNPLRCDRCGGRQSPCPICWQKYPAIKSIRSTKKRQKERPWQRNAFEDSLNLDAPPPVSATAEIDPDDLYAGPDDPVSLTHQTQHPILWQACFVCGHGAHASCMQAIQVDGRLGGKCPTEGCLCDCIAGSYRNKLNFQAAESRATLVRARDAHRASVIRDTQRVGESRAVRTARTILDSEGQQQQGHGLLTGAPGGSGRRVRVIEPPPEARMRGSRDGY